MECVAKSSRGVAWPFLNRGKELNMSLMEPQEVVFGPKAWRALRPLLLSPGFAVGECRRLETTTSSAYLVDDLRVSSEIPQGQQFPPLADLLVWAVDEGVPVPAQQVIDQIQPRASQSLVVGQFSIDHPEQWDAVHSQNGKITPLTGFRAVGPGMLKVSRDADDIFDQQSVERDSRTRGALGEVVYRKIRHSTVTLVGAGRNGSQLAWQLASLGVQHLRLIDPDHLEEHNLNAMPGQLASDVGRSKVRALADRLTAFRPDLLVTALEASATEAAAVSLLRQPADLLVTCCDSDTPRLATALIARETLKVHLDVGTHIEREDNDWQLFADVRLLLPGEGCMSCVGGLADREETLYELAAPSGALRRGVIELWHTQRAGSLVQLNSLTVSSAVQLWCDLLAGRLSGSAWQRLNWQPGIGLSTQAARVTPPEDCWLCQHQNRPLNHLCTNPTSALYKTPHSA